MKYKATEQLLRWLCAWAGLFQALVGIITLGYCCPPWYLDSAKRLAQWRFNQTQEVKDEN